MDLIERLFELRIAASASVVSQLGSTELQQRMHVHDPLEEYLNQFISEWRAGPRATSLLVLSGNAGDGKSDLLARLMSRAGDASDLRVITDATQADSPTEDQVHRLEDFFAPFADEPTDDPRLHVIALNVGMAMSFLENAKGFRALDGALRWDLGLIRKPPVGTPPFELMVVNLDRRDILARDGLLLTGMFERLDPDNADGIFEDLGRNCASCNSRPWCFVRTNLDLMQVDDVRAGLTRVLRDAARERNIHLSPRAVWDALSRFAGGDSEFFQAGHSAVPNCSGIARLANETLDVATGKLTDRLLWNLVFEQKGAGELGPVVAAAGDQDPVSITSKPLHAAETEVSAGSDRERIAFATTASHFARAPDTEEPVLATIASAMQQRSVRTGLAGALARGISRRAVIARWPADMAEDLTDSVTTDFDELLRSYGGWSTPDTPPAAVKTFTAEVLRAGVQEMFGTQGPEQAYFKVDAFAAGGQWDVLAPVDVGRVRPMPDPDVLRDRPWLRQVGYVPRSISCTVSGTAFFVVDLPLYRLLRSVVGGYSASSVDLESFFALRFACERLGGNASGGRRLLLRDNDNGSLHRLESPEDDLFGSLTFAPVL